MKEARAGGELRDAPSLETSTPSQPCQGGAGKAMDASAMARSYGFRAERP